MRLRGILFDKDGTLVDFDRTWGPAAYAAMRRLARGDRDRLEGLMRVSHYREAERRFAPTSPLLAGAASAYGPLWAEVLGRAADAAFLSEIDGLFRAEGLAALTPIGRPAEVGAALVASGYALGIATNDSEASGRAQAGALGFPATFVAGYDSGYGAKPGPGMVTAFAAHLGVPAGAVAMVGDSPYDLVAGRTAGALAIAVLSGPLGTSATAQVAPLADHVIGSIADLAALLARIDAEVPGLG